MKILLSINPQHIEKIFSGEKHYEYRKSMPSNANVSTVVVYSTKPVGLIVGEFEIDSVICDRPQNVWLLTAKGSGITESFFNEYFEDRSKAYAIKIGRVHRYDPPIIPSEIFTKFTPPQSFIYLKSEISNSMRPKQYDLGLG